MLLITEECGRSFRERTTAPLSINMLTRIIDMGTGIGRYSSLGYNSAGVPYVAYSDMDTGTLKIAWLDRSGYWDNVVAAGGNSSVNAGQYASMAISNKDNYYISYYNPITHSLEMINGPLPVDPGVISPPVTILDKPTSTTYATGLFTSLKRGPNGGINISYMQIIGDTPYKIIAAYPRYISWLPSGPGKPEVVDSGIEGKALITPLYSTPYSTSIDVAKDGTIWLAYYDIFNRALKIAKKQAGIWITQVVDDSGYSDGQYLSLTLDAKGYPHISYTENAGTAMTALKYAWYDGSKFHTEYVDREGGIMFGANSILLNPESNPVIAYYDASNNDLKIAFVHENKWNIYRLDTALLSGLYPSLALAPSGAPTVAYQQYAPTFKRDTLKFGIIDYNNL